MTRSIGVAPLRATLALSYLAAHPARPARPPSAPKALPCPEDADAELLAASGCERAVESVAEDEGNEEGENEDDGEEDALALVDEVLEACPVCRSTTPHSHLVIVVLNLEFAHDDDTPSAASAERLRRALEAPMGNGVIERVEVTGHASAVGDPQYNLSLSKARADKARALLLDAGIKSEAIDVQGAGDTDPLTATPAPNRRVLVRIHQRIAPKTKVRP